MKVQQQPSLPIQNLKEPGSFCLPLTSSAAVVAVSPYGLLAFAMRRVVRIFDSKAKAKVFTMEIEGQDLSAVSWKPEITDGTYLALGDVGGKISVLELVSGTRYTVETGGHVKAIVWDWDSLLLYVCCDQNLITVNLEQLTVDSLSLPMTPTSISLDPFGLIGLIAFDSATSSLTLIDTEEPNPVRPINLGLFLLQVEFCPWASNSLLLLSEDALLLYDIKADEISKLVRSTLMKLSQLVLSKHSNTSLIIMHQDSSITVWSKSNEIDSKVQTLDCNYTSNSLLRQAPATAFQGAFSLSPNVITLGLLSNSKVFLFDLELPQMKHESLQISLTQTYNFDFNPTHVVSSTIFHNASEILAVSPSYLEVTHRRKFDFEVKRVIKSGEKFMILSGSGTLYEYNIGNGTCKALHYFSSSVVDVAADSKRLAVLEKSRISVIDRKSFETCGYADFEGEGFCVGLLEDGSVAVSLAEGVWIWKGNSGHCLVTGQPYKRILAQAGKVWLLGLNGGLYELLNPTVEQDRDLLDFDGSFKLPSTRNLTSLYSHSQHTSVSLLSQQSHRYLRTLLTMTPTTDIPRCIEEAEVPLDLKACLPNISAIWVVQLKDEEELFIRMLNYAKLIGSRRELRFWTLAYQSCHELMMKQLEPRQKDSTQSLKSLQFSESANMTINTFREYETPTKYAKPRVITPNPCRTSKSGKKKMTPKTTTNENSRNSAKRTRSMQNSPFEVDRSKKRSLSPLVGKDQPTVKKVKRDLISADHTDTLLQLAVNTSNLLSSKSEVKMQASVRNSYFTPKKAVEADVRMDQVRLLLTNHPDVVLRVYKACTIAASLSAGAYNEVLAQGAKLLEDCGELEEAAELLFLSGKGVQACICLQNAGKWERASNAKVSFEDQSSLNVRWAYHLLNKRKTTLALEVALSSLHFHRVIQMLELAGLDELAFSYACFLESRRVIQRSQWHKSATLLVNSQSELSLEMFEVLRAAGAADYSGLNSSQNLLQLKTDFRSKLRSFPWLVNRVF